MATDTPACSIRPTLSTIRPPATPTSSRRGSLPALSTGSLDDDSFCAPRCSDASRGGGRWESASHSGMRKSGCGSTRSPRSRKCVPRAAAAALLRATASAARSSPGVAG
eukprot:7382074-Prymnesium_polylepis.1